MLAGDHANDLECVAEPHRSGLSEDDAPNMDTVSELEGVEERLGQYLIKHGKLDQAGLGRAMRFRNGQGEHLGTLLPKLGLVSERDMAQALSQVLRLPLIRDADVPAQAVLVEVLSSRFLKQKQVLPLEVTDKGLRIALADPLDTYAVDAVRVASGQKAIIHVAEPGLVERALERLYDAAATGVDGADTLAFEGDEELGLDVERLRDQASEAPVIRLVNQIISRAVDQRASDIHLEAFEDKVRLRYRIDGVLRETDPPPRHLRAAVVSRIKIMARLNIAERRLPQDGRIKLAIRGKSIDLRISTIPAMHGEGVVMRILDRDSVALDFASLGIGGANLKALDAILGRPHGIFLVTGPTGSGKTTSLYAALCGINSPDKKILTVEDPVEYQLEGINQVQVKPGIGLTFASVLRSFLRQDPDILMVGEIRDKETADIAVQAALTGHLVLSTLHTNDAASSITRLLDMGVPDYLLTSTVTGISAQRLVRTLCSKCRVRSRVLPEMAAHVGLDRQRHSAPLTVYRPGGCDACNNTGFRGRTCVMETLVMTDRVRQLVLQHAEAVKLHRAAVADGMVPMYDDGMSKVVEGVTTIEEVLRVSRDT
jgi:general secretion pathway protein E